eukprot:SAG31_NODE_2763_length_5128_cov_25.339232_2_plen_188_part_00
MYNTHSTIIRAHFVIQRHCFRCFSKYLLVSDKIPPSHSLLSSDLNVKRYPPPITTSAASFSIHFAVVRAQAWPSMPCQLWSSMSKPSSTHEKSCCNSAKTEHCCSLGMKKDCVCHSRLSGCSPAACVAACWPLNAERAAAVWSFTGDWRSASASVSGGTGPRSPHAPSPQRSHSNSIVMPLSAGSAN